MKMARLFGSLYLLVQGSFTIHFIVVDQSSDGEVYTGAAASAVLRPREGITIRIENVDSEEFLSANLSRSTKSAR